MLTLIMIVEELFFVFLRASSDHDIYLAWILEHKNIPSYVTLLSYDYSFNSSDHHIFQSSFPLRKHNKLSSRRENDTEITGFVFMIVRYFHYVEISEYNDLQRLSMLSSTRNVFQNLGK